MSFAKEVKELLSGNEHRSQAGHNKRMLEVMKGVWCSHLGIISSTNYLLGILAPTLATSKEIHKMNVSSFELTNYTNLPRLHRGRKPMI
jgi:hypothetical protein